LFIGIPAPESIFSPIQSLRKAWAETPGIRWVPEENLHITVFFFGNVSAELIPNLIEMVRVSLREFPPFELIFDQFCLAPKPKNPRMIWARYHKAEVFRQLVNRITDLYEQISPKLQQRRSPIPHITVARLREVDVGRQLELPPNVGVLGELPPNVGDWDGSHYNVTLPVEELVLWSSDLQPGGAVYEEVARFEL
jgi:2'-5' RNA ligase